MGEAQASPRRARARGVVSASGCCRCRGGVAAAGRAPPRRVPPGAIDAGCGSGTEPGYAVGGGGPPDMRDCFARIVLHVLSGGGAASCRSASASVSPPSSTGPDPDPDPDAAASCRTRSPSGAARSASRALGVPPHSITDLVCGLPLPALARGDRGRRTIQDPPWPRPSLYTFCFFSSPLRYQEEQMCAQFKRSNSQLQLFALEHPPHLVTSKT